MNQVIDDQSDLALSKNIFLDIEKIVQTNGDGDYMGAIIHYCERNNIEIESIAKYIKKNLVLKAKLQQEAEDLNYIQKTSRLPI
jgi:hypothetical protein